MKVPLIDLQAQHAPLEDELRTAITDVISSKQFILGPAVVAFEDALARYAGMRHAIAVSNGSDALLMTLMALGIGPGDEVIVPAFTFFGTAGSVSRCGATPVFADILSDTFNIDPASVEAAITPRTRAIMPVHLYGQCADMDALMQIAKRHDLALIEDAAQAIGATFNDQPIGALGTVATLSFYPTKNLSAVGEAGAILTSDDTLSDKLRIFRDHGQKPQYHHHVIGGNFRMDGIQGAALGVKLKHLDRWNDARRRIAATYDEAFNGSDATPPAIDARCKHVYHQYTIRSNRRDELRTFLGEQGIASGVYYPIPLHLQECFSDLGYRRGQLPVSEQAASEVLSLPVFPELSDQQQAHVIAQIRAFGV